jgi:hypothetical protein
MLINVIQEDIDSGLKRNPSDCAIAKSIKRIANHDYINIAVFSNALHLNGKSYELPQNATDFIRSFDIDKKFVNPVTIEIPELVLV